MKKYLLSLAVMLGLGVMASCSNQESDVVADIPVTVSQEPEGQFDDLFAELGQYNNQYQASLTRKGGGWWKWLGVALADGLGACFGAVGGAATSAIAAVVVIGGGDIVWGGIKNLNNPDDDLSSYQISDLGGPTNISAQMNETYSDSIGYYHNNAIVSLLLDSVKCQEFDDATGSSKVAVVNGVWNDVCDDSQLSSYEEKTVFINSMNLASLILSSESVGEFIAGVEKKSAQFDLSDAELHVLGEFFTGLTNLASPDYSTQYMIGFLQ